MVTQMDITQQIEHELTRSADGHLSADAVETLLAEFHLTDDDLLLKLLPIAASFAQCSVSHYSVGAAARGGSGAIYLGANLEFERCSLNQTIHAEQSAVVNAATHDESFLTQLAITAPPCGYCRQFLAELTECQQLQIVIPNLSVRSLPYYLPDAFEPGALGRRAAFLSHVPRSPEANVESRTTESHPDPLLAAATAAFTRAYSPYTNAPAAIALRTLDGHITAGFSIENCAFTPSLTPLQVAVANLALSRRFPHQIAEALLIHTGNPRFDYRGDCADILEKIAPGAVLFESLKSFDDHG
jgi:cytidine deaminase